MHSDFKNLGFGVGLRSAHFDVFLNNQHGRTVSWVEALTENYLPWADGKFRKPFSTLQRIRQKVPVALHGVSLSLGSVDPIDRPYLLRLKRLAREIDPAWISDHLCWTGINGINLHDLLPLPYTEEALDLVSKKIVAVQEILGRRILVENVSSYLEFSASHLTEWDFLCELVERADCGILLDINNIYVSSQNHGFDPFDYLKAVPASRVGQIHLAGHRNKGTHLIDTHDEAICAEVFALYRWYASNNPMVSTMIEWDDNIPEWSVLEAEVKKIKMHHEIAMNDLGKRSTVGSESASITI